jgi:hypothetical protein
MNALVSAFCTVLAYHSNASGASNAAFRDANSYANIQLYKSTLETLRVAAASANDPNLTSKINACGQLYAQVEMVN